jgi:hypothetical protein
MVRIIAKCLAKQPDQRYQSGRELADDLLALSRPGSAPTMRQNDVPTAPGSWPPRAASAPTIATAPTVAGTAPTRQVAPAPGGGKAVPSAPLPAAPRQPTRPAPAVAPAAPVSPAKSRTGLIIGAAAVGLLVIVGTVAVLGWYVFLRKPERTADAGRAGVPPAVTAPSVTLAPAPAATLAVAPPPTAVSGPTAAPATAPAAVSSPAAGTRPGTAPAPRAPAREAAPAPGGVESAPHSSYSVLDEEPAAEADGRDAGEALADKFRSNQGGSTSSGFGASGRYRPRERSPRDLTPFERPAVATVRHLMDREEAFYRRESRYGTFDDLGRSGPFLDVPSQTRTFQRRGYRFELTLERDGFRIVAEPTAPGPRSFVGDDSGFIRAGVE